MRSLAVGEVNDPIAGTERKDEIGEMARAVDVFRLSAIERERLESAARATREREAVRQQQLEAGIATFRGAISTVVSTLNQEIGRTRSSAEILSKAADSASSQAETASRASTGAASNAQTVAAATEELGASIREISSQAHA
jgi:methyl-accepting chemotaxis protein